MTVKILKQLFADYDIPDDVELMSDSGWEGCATRMDGVYYNAEENTIVFTQYPSTYDDYHKDDGWELLYGEYAYYEYPENVPKMKKIKEKKDGNI